MSNKLFYLICLALVLAIGGFAQAELLVLVNPGFEDPVLAEDDYTWGDVPGWTLVGGEATDIEGTGVWNVTLADFDPVIAPEGENVLFTEYVPEGIAKGVAQVLTETFAADTDYTLTAEVGNSYYYYFAGYSVQLLAGGTVIAEDNDTLWPDYMLWATSTVVYTYDQADSALVGQPLEIRLLNLELDKDVAAPDVVGVEFDNVTLSYVAGAEPGITIPVDPNSDLAAANELAQPGDTILFAEGTYMITSQIEVKDGVTYQGAGAELTIIDGNDATRAFVAWGDRGATDGQVDANGVSLPNLTGPTGWVIEGMTIQNCVSDAENRQDILSVARDLLTNYTGTPYTLATAQEENVALVDNPDAFEALSGGADDDLTDAELQAYLEAVPPGSEGHYVVNDDKDDDGGAVILKNGAAGTIRNCAFSNNAAVNDAGSIAVEGPGGGATIQNCVFSNNLADDDGGAIAVDSVGLAVTIENCAFNSCSALADDGGAIYLSGDASTYIVMDTNFTDCTAINDGGALKGDGGDSSYTISNCTFSNVSADDDGGAIALSASGQAVSIENCAFNSCSNNEGDDAGAIYMSSSDSTYTITGSTFTDCISDDDAGALYCSGGADYVLSNCAFDRNSCGDEGGAIKIGPDNATCTFTGLIFTDCYAGDDAGAVFMDGDGSSYEVTDCSFIGNTCNDDWAAFLYKPYRSELIMTNCSFVSNGLDADGVVVGDDSVLGVDRDDAGAVTISNCLIAYNACNADWILEVKDLATISNCTFIGNESPKQTIGLRANAWDSTGDENDDVVAGNSTISNCLFINNTTASAVIGNSKNADFTATVTNCLFFGNFDQDGAATANTNDEYPEVGTIDVSAVTDAVQIVVDPAGDYHPAAGSPAIDASDPATATDADIEGTAAVGVRDVGAYESVN